MNRINDIHVSPNPDNITKPDDKITKRNYVRPELLFYGSMARITLHSVIDGDGLQRGFSV
jgi:hypothetical protein